MKIEYDYDVTCVIMGGGRGTRLNPLTKDRSKPAVPLGAKYRLIDIPISNCLNSGLNRIHILTQFNSASLHRHIHRSFHFDRFSRGFVGILAAQQTPHFEEGASWYEGTADAVRKNLPRIREADPSEVLILSGDQIYQMNFREVLATHRGTEPKADSAPVTIAALLVPRERARALGCIEIDADGHVKRFVEKPGNDDALLDSLVAPKALVSRFDLDDSAGPWVLANMGIYVFNRDLLESALDNDAIDFGREILPELARHYPMRAHLFHGYWEDIGTIGAFLEANLGLASPETSFDFYNEARPIYTRARLLPASKIASMSSKHSLIAEACRVAGADIENSLVGIRSAIGRNVTIRGSYVMGNDSFASEISLARDRQLGIPPLGIGNDVVIENAIVDKNVHIGDDVEIRNLDKHETYDDEYVAIRDGVVVVPRGGIVPSGYRI